MSDESTSEQDGQPQGRRARKALAVRHALFEAGLAAFERQPLSLVSILDITEAADVAKGVFYLQFKSKDDYLLALWEEVKRRFLDRLRDALSDSGEQRLRVAARQFRVFARQAPAATRFWLRMAGYFPDEVGPPGHLTRIRQAYIEQLAAIIAGIRQALPSEQDLQRALILDTLCWAVISAEAHLEEAVLDDDRILRAAEAAMQSTAEA